MRKPHSLGRSGGLLGCLKARLQLLGLSQVAYLQPFWVQFGLLWASEGPGHHFTAPSFVGILFSLAGVLFNFAQASSFWTPSPKISSKTRNPKKSTMKPANHNHPTPKSTQKPPTPKIPPKLRNHPKSPPTPIGICAKLNRTSTKLGAVKLCPGLWDAQSRPRRTQDGCKYAKRPP
jgi:hypothetical protein